MRRFLAAAATAALLLASVGAMTASANNDPHRTFLPAGSFDLVGACVFTVHFDFLTDNEYGTFSTLPNGSTVVKVTGSVTVRLSNAENGKWLVVNAGGPSMITYAPDGLTWNTVYEGRSLLFSSNLTDFGFPSNLVATSGLLTATGEAANNWAGTTMTSWGKMPHVMVDVCAALS